MPAAWAVSPGDCQGVVSPGDFRGAAAALQALQVLAREPSLLSVVGRAAAELDIRFDACDRLVARCP